MENCRSLLKKTVKENRKLPVYKNSKLYKYRIMYRVVYTLLSIFGKKNWKSVYQISTVSIHVFAIWFSLMSDTCLICPWFVHERCCTTKLRKSSTLVVSLQNYSTSNRVYLEVSAFSAHCGICAHLGCNYSSILQCTLGRSFYVSYLGKLLYEIIDKNSTVLMKNNAPNLACFVVYKSTEKAGLVVIVLSHFNAVRDKLHFQSQRIL